MGNLSTCLVAIGSNRTDRLKRIQQACEWLAADPRVKRFRVSQLWDSAAAVGARSLASEGAPDFAESTAPFLNGALLFETDLAAEAVLSLLLDCETRAGRRRTERWGARELDLDLLLYDQQVCQTPRLTLPHPRLIFRRFVLEPAVELAPDWFHPVLGLPLREILTHLHTAPPYLALTGRSATSIGQQLAALTQVCFVTDPVPDHAPHQPQHNALARHLDRLQARHAALLAAFASCGQDARWLVSDFWLEASWHDARRQLYADVFPQFDAVWHHLQPQMRRPRLLVLLEALNPVPPSGKKAPSQPSGQPVLAAHSMRDDLLSIVPQPCLSGMAASDLNEYVAGMHRTTAWCQPWFALATADRSWAVRELVAAMEAMSNSPTVRQTP